MAPRYTGARAELSKRKPMASSANNGSEANAQLSKPAAIANPFVAFNAGVSKEDRKAVRVQAAKASAAARKATIARKQAQQRQELAEPSQGADARPSIPLVTRPQEAVEGKVAGIKAKRKRTFPQPGDWRLQTGRFKSSGHATAGARQPIPSPKKEEEVAQDAILAPVFPAKSVPTTSFFGQFTPEEPQMALATVPHSYWQQHPHTQATGRSIHEFRAWPSQPEHIKQRFEDQSTEPADIELPLTPVSIASLPSPSRIGLAFADPFNCYPVPYRPIYDSLLHHMLTIFAPRGWPALKITRQEGLDWEHFMTQHALAEPALFFVRLLFASGDMIHLGVLNTEISLWLQAEAIRTINEALARPHRATSDGIILAVGRIALHECMYGDRKAANLMHRPAQRRMIDLRGGMKALEMPALVKRLMRWADRVMSVQGGTERFLPDDEDQGNKSFTTEQSVNVLERWVPQEERAMRKKIAISDLLSD